MEEDKVEQKRIEDWYLKKQYWRDKLGIQVGMTKAEALDRFREWRVNRTCDRCIDKDWAYDSLCPIKLVCREEREDGEREVTGRSDNGSGVDESLRALKTRRKQNESRDGDEIRQNPSKQKTLFRERRAGIPGK